VIGTLIAAVRFNDIVEPSLATPLLSAWLQSLRSQPARTCALDAARRIGVWSTTNRPSGRGEPPPRPEVSAPSKPRAAPIQVGV